MPAFDRGTIFRTCRMLHAYLSAFAFLSLLLFSFTGVLLNHREWMWSSGKEETAQVQLTPAEIAAAQAGPEPNEAIAAAVGRKTPLLGAFTSGDQYEGRAVIRLQGPKGGSEIAVDLASGAAEVTRTRAGFVTMLTELHRGVNSGGAWRFVIDATGVIVGLLSLIGYVLFLTLRFRLRTSLILTAVSLVGMVLVVVLLVA